jgi:hyperosmotically inducible protein
MRNYVFFDIFDWIEGEVRDGVVTLTGWVHQPWHKSEYESRAESVVGVKQVKNEIQVLPTSIYDDQLRIAAARLIYGYPGFEQYAIQPYPPIHIIVQNGRVILRGVVSSQVDRQLAEEIVRSRLLAFDVTNDLVVAGEKPRR